MRKIFFRFAAPALAALIFFTACGKKSTDSDVIKIGATFPLSGEVASYGIKAKRGIEMAVKNVNDRGGVLGKTVEVIFMDDRNNAKEAVSIFTRFSSIDRYPVVFGSAGSTISLALAPLATQNRVILISPISSSSLLSEKGGDYFFRTCPADNLQAEILANWIWNSGAKKVVIIYTNNSWGQPLAEGFKKLFESMGGSVLFSEGVEESSADFRTVISKIKQAGVVDAIVSPTYPKEGGGWVKQLKEAGVQMPLFGGDNWGSPEFVNIAGEAANGVMYTAPESETGEKYQDFAREYKAVYGEEPDVFGAYAYDAAQAVFEAISAAGATEPTAIRRALLCVDFEGVSGHIAFKSNGDLAREGFSKKTIENGKARDIK